HLGGICALPYVGGSGAVREPIRRTEHLSCTLRHTLRRAGARAARLEAPSVRALRGRSRGRRPRGGLACLAGRTRNALPRPSPVAAPARGARGFRRARLLRL